MTIKLAGEVSELVLQVTRSMDDAAATGRTVSPQDNLVSDHGLTSLAFVSLVMAIEEHFDIAFTDEDLVAESFETVQTIADLLESKLGHRSNIDS